MDTLKQLENIIDKQKILETAVTLWDKASRCFITQSPQADYVLGAGLTEQESKEAFITMVEGQYQEYLKGTHGVLNARKVGRPQAGRVTLNTRLAPDIKAFLAQLAKQQKRSQGEIIEALVDMVRTKKVRL